MRRMTGDYVIGAPARLIGLLFAFIGALIVAAYLWMPAEFAALAPGIAVTAPNTALCFILLGIALRLSPIDPIRRHLGAAVTLITLLVMLQRVFDFYPLYQPLQFLLTVQNSSNTVGPTSAMSLVTAVGLFASGVFLALLPGFNAPRLRMALLLTTFACGLIGLLARLLDIADIFVIDPYSRGTSWVTASVLTLLAIGLGVDGFKTMGWAGYFVDRVDRRLTAIGMALLMILGICAGMTGVAAVVGKENRASMVLMRNALDYNVALIDNVIAERLRLHLMLAELPARYRPRTSDFRCPSNIVTALPLQGSKAELLWSNALYLRTDHFDPLGGNTLTLCSDISRLHTQQQYAWNHGQTAETMICAKSDSGIRCLPTRLRQMPFQIADSPANQQLPVALALAGKSGAAVMTDYRGYKVVTAYRSGNWNLGVVQKIDASEFYQPLRHRIWLGMAAVLALTLAGGLALFRFTHPMVGALNRLRLRTEAIVDNVPSAVVGTDEHGVLDWINPAAEKMFGTADPSSHHHLFSELLDSASWDTYWQLVSLAQQGRSESALVRAKRVDGSLFDVDLRLSAYEFSGEKKLIAVLTDVSERVQRERELQWWKQIFDNAQWGVVVGGSTEPLMQMLNPYFARMHGYSVDELEGASLLKVFAPTEHQSLMSHIRKAHERGHYCFESVHLRKDGSQFPVLIDVTAVKNDQGEVLYRIANVLDISERKQMEAKLTEREQMIRMIVDTQTELISRWLPDSTLTFVNQALCRFIGRKESDMLGKRWLEQHWIREDQITALRAAIEQNKQNAIPHRREHFVRDAAGRSRLIAWVDTPIFDRDGNLVAFQSAGHDITETRKAELALKESEQRFKAIFNSMFQFTGVLSPSGMLLEINDTALAFAGVQREECLGRYFWETLWWSATRHARSDLHVAIGQAALGQFIRYEVEACGRGEKKLLLDFSIKPVCDDSGAVVLLIAEGRDITEAKQAREFATEQETRFRALGSNIPGLIFQLCWDPLQQRSHFLYVSKGSKELCGQAPEAFIEGRVELGGCIVEEDRQGYIASFQQAANAVEEWQWNGRLINPQPTMPPVWVSLRASPRVGEAGELIFDGLMLNISDLKLQEEEVERSRGMLRELAAHVESVREEERKRIAREVHDELGQTLTALRMEIAVMEMQTEASDLQLHQRSLSMKSLVDQSISVMRNVASSLRPVALDMGLVPALKWLAHEFQQRTGIICSVDVFAKRIKLDDDRATVLFRIVQESLTNVLRHAEAKQVRITLGKVASHYVLEIRDDGKGFDARSTLRSNAYGLLGIRERATMLGGAANISSEPGVGTVISVEVPEK